MTDAPHDPSDPRTPMYREMTRLLSEGGGYVALERLEQLANSQGDPRATVHAWHRPTGGFVALRSEEWIGKYRHAHEADLRVDAKGVYHANPRAALAYMQATRLVPRSAPPVEDGLIRYRSRHDLRPIGAIAGSDGASIARYAADRGLTGRPTSEVSARYAADKANGKVHY